MKTININPESCTLCGRCVRVCPSLIFNVNSENRRVVISNLEGCISCGHCVAVCPTGSVAHSEFPADKVHDINRNTLPTPDQVIGLCRARRSNRAFSTTPIAEQSLDLIIEAAHRAPTASNQQQVQFTLITDPVLLRAVCDFTVNTFTSIVNKVDNPAVRPLLKYFVPGVYNYLPTFHRLMAAHEQEQDLILRGATALLLIHTPKASRFGCQDANLAYQNASLMAESLGVGQFYTGFVCSAIQQAGMKKLCAAISHEIPGVVHAGMALGMRSIEFERYIDKHDLTLTRL